MTLAELCDYVRGAQERDCALVARLCCVVANAHRGRDQKAWSEDDFNPLELAKKQRKNRQKAKDFHEFWSQFDRVEIEKRS